MGTPVHIMLALTREGIRIYHSSRKGRKGARSGISKRHVNMIRKEIASYGFKSGRPEVMALPSDRMHKGRKQYNSKFLLKLGKEWAKKALDWHTKVLVITDADMYTTGVRYLVGQAELDGKVAVVSITRIRSGDERRFVTRLTKEILHELGHTLGLAHCRDRNCVMYSSKTLPDSDIKSRDYCKRCQVKIGRALSRK
jgi:predicted Zn-dependent protease